MAPPPEEIVLHERPRLQQRCPYCHDCLEGGEIEDSGVLCEGCGTSHHRACLAELGGCTVMGCSGGKPLAEGVEQVRARVRERVGRFVANHSARPAPVRSRVVDEVDFDRVRAILRERAELRGEGRAQRKSRRPRQPRANFSGLQPLDWLGLLLLGAGGIVIWGLVLGG